MLPPSISFNESWFTDGNLAPLVAKFFPVGWSAGRSKLIVATDNVPVHISRMIQDFFGRKPLKRLSYPLYFPNISPLNFDLFGKIKSALIGREIPDESDLLEAVTEILNGISYAELYRVFRSWIEHVERVIEAGGDYLTSSLCSSSLSHSQLTPFWRI
jgi:hypothetical protein